VTVVVTGAGGHAGTNLVLALLAAGREVRAVDLVQPRHLTALGAEWVAADVRDRTAMRTALSGAQVVFHLAAVISTTGSRGGLVESVNVAGVTATARAALDVGVPRFVHCSSIHSFDIRACRGRVIDESAPPATDPRLPSYDRSKAAGEDALRRVVDAGLDAVILNPSGLLGPLDLAPSRMGTVLRAAARRHMPATVDGSFDWVDVRDLVAALIAAEHAGGIGENYLIGGTSAGVDVLAGWAAASAGVRPPVAHLPLWVARATSPAANWLARRVDSPLLYTSEALDAVAARPIVDHGKATRVLGHQPRPLQQTVADLIASFREAGEL
jgi:dihydroflavonol-4-reductase